MHSLKQFKADNSKCQHKGCETTPEKTKEAKFEL